MINKRIMTVVGARPQFIKAAAVSRHLQDQGLKEVLVHTGQHYDANMSDIFFRELGLKAPGYHLGIGSGGHGAQTGEMLKAIESVLLQERPDLVMVYGDTNSTLAGALAAAKLHIPVAHVEAGLRSYNRNMPEELNRVLTDHLSDLLFAPSSLACDNLKREGIQGASVLMSGDVMYDIALRMGALADQESRILENLKLSSRGYVLATVHRAENTDHPERLLAILYGLEAVARKLPVLFPMHPRTRKLLVAAGMAAPREPGMRWTDPVGYLDMIQLEKHARLIATDSGGVQKEAYFQQVPCVTLRDETEWTELVDLGWNRLVPPRDSESLATALQEALDAPPGLEQFPYGTGAAGIEIAKTLRRYLEPAEAP